MSGPQADELRWIWLTHDDSDHTGSLEAVMKLAPDAQLATHGLGALRLSTVWPVPLDRVHALALGDELDVGDRTLRALRPPTYDNPMSTAIYDESTSTLPPTRGRVDELLAVVATVPDAEPFVAPDAATFSQIAAALGSPTTSPG